MVYRYSLIDDNGYCRGYTTDLYLLVALLEMFEYLDLPVTVKKEIA